MSFLQTDFTNRIICLFNFHVKSFTEADYIYISLVLTDFIAGLMKPHVWGLKKDYPTDTAVPARPISKVPAPQSLPAGTMPFSTVCGGPSLYLASPHMTGYILLELHVFVLTISINERI